MTVVDITAVPVPDGHRAAYIDFSRRMAEVYRDHGATRIVEYWQDAAADDQSEFHAEGLDHEPDDLRGFTEVMGASHGESVVVSVTEWPSQEVRDRGTAAATSDPRVLATLDEDPVFEGHRLVAGTFAPLTEHPVRD